MKISKDEKGQEKDLQAQLTSEFQSNSSGYDLPTQIDRPYPSVILTDSDNAAFEQAIQEAVAATSRGDLEQDRLIEKAIRASVIELQSASRKGDHDEAIDRAIQASIIEVTRAWTEESPSGSTATHDVKDHKEKLRAALHRSVSMHTEAP